MFSFSKCCNHWSSWLLGPPSVGTSGIQALFLFVAFRLRLSNSPPYRYWLVILKNLQFPWFPGRYLIFSWLRYVFSVVIDPSWLHYNTLTLWVVFLQVEQLTVSASEFLQLDLNFVDFFCQLKILLNSFQFGILLLQFLCCVSHLLFSEGMMLQLDDLPDGLQIFHHSRLVIRVSLFLLHPVLANHFFQSWTLSL